MRETIHDAQVCIKRERETRVKIEQEASTPPTNTHWLVTHCGRLHDTTQKQEDTHRHTQTRPPVGRDVPPPVCVYSSQPARKRNWWFEDGWRYGVVGGDWKEERRRRTPKGAFDGLKREEGYDDTILLYRFVGAAAAAMVCVCCVCAWWWSSYRADDAGMMSADTTRPLYI